VTVLDWSSKGPDGAGTVADKPKPCVLCHVPTIIRSPHGKHCHKVCAEAWAAAHTSNRSEVAA
jgi:hypothetical protein